MGKSDHLCRKEPPLLTGGDSQDEHRSQIWGLSGMCHRTVKFGLLPIRVSPSPHTSPEMSPTQLWSTSFPWLGKEIKPETWLRSLRLGVRQPRAVTGWKEPTEWVSS